MSGHITIPQSFTANHCESYIHPSGQWGAHIPLQKHPPRINGYFPEEWGRERGRQNINS